MSPAPRSWSDRAQVLEHGATWKTIMEMVRSGSSWSGRERNCVFLNAPPRVLPAQSEFLWRFANISATSGLDFPDDGRAMAVVDWDHDGDQDIWFHNRTGPRLRLMRNRSRDIGGNQGFVSVRLQGTSCNRDAIGARVEVDLDERGGRRLVASVSAGDAFLSQSSRWLHFGLGAAGKASIRRTTVYWPGGGPEVFDGIQRNGRYTLVQGTGKATPAKLRSGIHYAGTATHVPPPTSAARIVFPGRIPFPELELHEGGQVKETLSRDGPLLITFWMSSCPHCRSELKRLASSSDAFRQQGVGVLAICLDGLETSDGTVSPSVKSYLRDVGFDFPCVAGTRDFVRRVLYLQQALFDMHPDPVVPLSFLVDADRNLIAMYRGVTEVDWLLADAELTREDNRTLRDRATPFSGRWFTQPASDSQIAEIVGKELLHRIPEEALRCYEIAIGTAQEASRKQELANDLTKMHVQLARSPRVKSQGRVAHHLRQGIRWAPKSAALWHELGGYLTSQGRYTEAEAAFREALRLRPDSVTARQSLESLLQTKRQTAGE